MSGRRPGRRQQELLNLMQRYGGYYPPRWRLGHDRRRVLDKMVDCGWIRRIEHPSGKPLYRINT